MARLIILVFVSLFIHSCDTCANLDCLASNYSVSFRVLSKSGNTDLLFGPEAVYKKDSIRAFRILGSDTTFLSNQFTPINLSGSDSALVINFFPESNADVYLQLSAADVDTLQPTYEHFNTKCCGAITQVQTISYNKQAAVPATQGAIELRK